MARAPHVIRQRDFSSGELIEHAKRRDDVEIVRAGARKMRNWRILNTGAIENRSGRSLLYVSSGRTERIRMTTAALYDFCFGQGTLTIRNSAGAIVASQGGYPWTTTTVKNVVWQLVGKDVVIFFAGMRPQVARWDGATTWTFLQYSFKTDLQGRVLQPYHRFAAVGITLLPSGTTGSITLTASASVFVAGHIGTVFRYLERQMLITAVASGTSATATVLETLPPRIVYTFANPAGFRVSDVVEGTVSGTKGVITDIVGSSVGVTHFINYNGFAIASDNVVGPFGRTGVSAPSPTGPFALTIWDEQVCSDVRGWPQSGFFDQNRFGMCDFQGVPEAICWSRIGVYDDFDVLPLTGGAGAGAADAMFEFAPAKARVYHVSAGADTFVFTDRGVSYIPISTANPLTPGSIEFREITSDPPSSVKPASTQEGPIYVAEGLSRLNAIVGTGQTARPYLSRDVSELHSHLFSGIKAIAVSAGGTDLPERYVFAVNEDGTVAVGKYSPGKEWVGWVPWASDGAIEWISTLVSTILTTTKYTINATDRRFVEEVDADAYLDGQVAVDTIPAALADGTDNNIHIGQQLGTRIGDMTAAGGLAAAFDDTTSHAAAACAGKASATSAYVGKTLPTAIPVAAAWVWGSNDQGFVSGANPSVTLTLYGKNGAAPASATDGTSLGTTTFTDTANESVGRGITSSDLTTAYLHVWVTVSQGGGAATVSVAELHIGTPGLVRLAPNAGTGDLWFMAGGTVDLMIGERYLGTRAVDASGNLTAVEGEDLVGEGVVVGFDWDATLEPFMPHLPGGQSNEQALRERAVRKGAVALQNSTGVAVQNVAGSKEWKRATRYRTGENQDGAPTLREEVLEFTAQGRDHDPRFVVIKDDPGPVRVLEITVEIEG